MCYSFVVVVFVFFNIKLIVPKGNLHAMTRPGMCVIYFSDH